MGWFGDAGDVRAEWVSFGAGGPDTEVHVPLIRGEGDPSVRVVAYVGDQVRTLARLDLSPGASVRMGALLRIRSGLPEPVRGRLVVPVLRVGDLVLRNLVVEQVPGEDLVVGLAALPGIGIHVRPGEGDVVFLPAEEVGDRLAIVGDAVPWALPPGPAELQWTEVVVDPSARVMATRIAWHPVWKDADTVLGDLLRDDAQLLGPTSGPDFLGTLRWRRVSPRWFRTGDLESLRESDARLSVAASDDCVVLSEIAERAVRVGGPASAIDRPVELWESWRSMTVKARQRQRDAGEGIDDACGRIGRFGGGRLWDPVDPWPTARLAWTERNPSAARFALDAGAESPALRLVVLDEVAARGIDEAVWAATLALRSPTEPHALTRALAVADRVRLAPVSLAERIVAGVPIPIEELSALPLSRPGDPAAACWFAAGQHTAVVPSNPTADCLAAVLLRARREGRVEVERSARAELAHKWPDVWLDDPDPAGVRTLQQIPEER